MVKGGHRHPISPYNIAALGRQSWRNENFFPGPHPGVLLALIGTALAVDRWRALIPLPLLLGGFIVKIKAEERFMAEAFGEDYARYRAAVPALIPLIY